MTLTQTREEGLRDHVTKNEITKSSRLIAKSGRKLSVTTTPRERGCNAETSTLQIMLPSAASPSKRKGAVCVRGSEAARVVLCGNEQWTHKKVEPKKKRTISDTRRKQSRLRANVKSDETELRMAQWWRCTKQAALSHAISLIEKASGISQSACVRNWTRGLPKVWPRKAQRTAWLAVWIVAGDFYLRPSHQLRRKSRRTTSQAGNVEI